jgi:hypothetical protein
VQTSSGPTTVDLKLISQKQHLDWRHTVLATLVFGSLAWMLSLEPIAQSTRYHFFADTRPLLGMPNFFDVMSNLPFVLIGLSGLLLCMKQSPGSMRSAWAVLFTGVAFVGIGSAYYHWNPSNATLVWDRLPMTIGFMGLFIALLGECVSVRLATLSLIPAVMLGLATVLYWHWSDDLRPYIWLQLIPFLTIPTVMMLFRSGFSRHWLLLVAAGWYGLAKAAELYDPAIFISTHELVSGHTLKHLLAATGCYAILLMIRTRKVLTPPAD